MILGLTGSLGSGKSTVAEIIRELTGAFIIDADEITRQLQVPGAAAHGAIVAAFGTSVALPDGHLDRKKLAELVFGDDLKRQKLNAIVHPLVRQEQEKLLREHQNDELIVLMVPLLYEVGMQDMADKVLVVAVNEQIREERLRRRSGMTTQEITDRLKAQMHQDEKARRADFVVDNSGSPEDTRRQVLEVLRTLGVQASASGPAS